MSWKIHDEWLDLAASRHVVIFRNSDTGAEHHLIHEFKLSACPHCGRPSSTEETALADFRKMRDDTLFALQAHHRKVMRYQEQHKNARLGNGPK